MAARPTTHRAPDRPAAALTRAAVRGFSGGAEYAIEWDVRPVYDFVFSLSDDAGSTDDLPAADRKWLADARASLPQDVLASVSRPEHEIAIQIATFAVEHPELRTPRQFVEAVEAANPRDVVRAVLCEAFLTPGLPEMLERAINGDEAVMAEITELLPDWHREERLAMLRDPAGTHAAVVAALRGWLELFEPISDRIATMGERDYALRAADRGTLKGADLIERTTNGLRWLGEPGIRRVILAPSYFSRPYNFLLAGPDWRFFGYPIADEALDAGDPLSAPPSVVRLHRALGDDTRMKILKLLAGRDLYLTEIAQQLDLSKPTIKHHLALLRSAGLVTIVEAGTVMYYSLRRQRLDDASIELKRFLVDNGPAN
ncbi:MAG TPA: metalloregulator ArsR/SmtB family transcription factor [Candidatus Limnocylindrales bacterium]|jgi:DNA-binding transcriptional ArsR family regulator|nr:metalloregulator ArsR/SmtB family transcription factor [Candidatus Limnocylindrales bacterium]